MDPQQTALLYKCMWNMQNLYKMLNPMTIGLNNLDIMDPKGWCPWVTTNNFTK